MIYHGFTTKCYPRVCPLDTAGYVRTLRFWQYLHRDSLHYYRVFPRQ